MDDISTKQKSQLVRQIRSQYSKNQYDIQYHIEKDYNVNDTEKNVSSESFKLRCILAIMLVVFALLFDVLEIKPLGINMEQIFQMIAENNIK